MNENSTSKLIKDSLPLIFGGLAIAGLIVAVFAIIGKFHWTVITGAALGAAAGIMNQLLLVILIGRAFDRARSERGEGELTEEQIAEFTKKQKQSLNNSVKISYFIRLPMLAGVVLAAFLLPGVFNAIAFTVAIVGTQLLIMFSGLFAKKKP